MTLEFLDKVYKEIFSGEVVYLVNTSRAIGGLLVAYSLYKGLMQSFTTTGQAVSKESNGFSPYMLGRSVFLFMLILFIPQILTSFDSILVSIEKAALKGFNAQPLDFDLNVLKFDPPAPDETPMSLFGRMISKLVELVNPLTWLGGSMSYVLQGIIFVVDFMIYPVFLAERYFVLGLIKIFAPLLVALSIYEKTRDYVYNLFKIYAIYFLVIIPYMFASVFVTMLHNGMLEQFKNANRSMTVALSAGLLQVIIMLLVIIVKIRLYKRSLPFMKELIK